MRKGYRRKSSDRTVAVLDTAARPSIFSCFFFNFLRVCFLPSRNPLTPHTRVRGALNHADGTIFPCWVREHYAASVACYDKERERESSWWHICICIHQWHTIHFDNRFALVRNDPDCWSPVSSLHRHRCKALSNRSFADQRCGKRISLSYRAKHWGWNLRELMFFPFEHKFSSTHKCIFKSSSFNRVPLFFNNL